MYDSCEGSYLMLLYSQSLFGLSRLYYVMLSVSYYLSTDVDLKGVGWGRIVILVFGISWPRILCVSAS
jgi:hypothetical protein